MLISYSGSEFGFDLGGVYYKVLGGVKERFIDIWKKHCYTWISGGNITVRANPNFNNKYRLFKITLEFCGLLSYTIKSVLPGVTLGSTKCHSLIIFKLL